MTEIKTKHIKTDFYEPKQTYKSKAKSVRGVIEGLLIKFRKDLKYNTNTTYHPEELIIIFEEALRKFNKHYKDNKITKVEIIEGWEKSGGEFPIEKNFENDFIVEIWHKDNKEKRIVKKEDLNRMIAIIRKLKIGEEYKCYDIAKLMGMDWKEDVWKNRMSVYFPLYYIPLKLLSHLRVINYGGNKRTIVRLK